MSYQGRIFGVGNDEAGDALRGAVGVEGVGLLLDVLSDARAGTFGNSLCEHGHEFAVARDLSACCLVRHVEMTSPIAGEAGERGEIAFDGEFGGRCRIIANDLGAASVESQRGTRYAAYSDVIDLHCGGEFQVRERFGVITSCQTRTVQ